MTEDLFCKIFVDGYDTRLGLTEDIARLFGVMKADEGYIDTEWGEVYVLQNSDRDATAASREVDAFLYFRHLVELEPKLSEGGRQKTIAVISKLLVYFWSNSIRAVAACNFERELPRNGGAIGGRIVHR